MARRSASDGDTSRKSVAEILAAAGVTDATPRRRRRLDEPEPEPQVESEVAADPTVLAEPEVPAEPDAPAQPDVVDEPEVADEPEVPAEPVAEQPGAEDMITGEPLTPLDEAETAAAQAEPAKTASPVLVAIGEIIVAAILGIGISYVFRLLWELQPYVAAGAAPVVLAVIVWIVGQGRRRLGMGAMPMSVLLPILIVVTVLVILPAAWLLDG